MIEEGTALWLASRETEVAGIVGTRMKRDRAKGALSIRTSKSGDDSELTVGCHNVVVECFGKRGSRRAGGRSSVLNS